LSELCEQWRTLGNAEGASIESADWEAVARSQEGKRGLQVRMTAAIEAIQQQAAREGIRPEEIKRSLRQLAAELIALEEENRARLLARRQATVRQLDASHRASRNLRQMHKAYTSSEEPLWESYG
jgi:hypothetical protein